MGIHGDKLRNGWAKATPKKARACPENSGRALVFKMGAFHFFARVEKNSGKNV
jgi:hypothetical protein